MELRNELVESDILQPTHNSLFGWHLIAKQPIPAHETIIDENSLVSIKSTYDGISLLNLNNDNKNILNSMQNIPKLGQQLNIRAMMMNVSTLLYMIKLRKYDIQKYRRICFLNGLNYKLSSPTSLAIFPKTTILSHSCSPNCYTKIKNYNDEANIIIKTSKHINIGESLTISYIPLSTLTLPTLFRQFRMWSKQAFICQCDRCRSKFDAMLPFKCPSCHSGLAIPQSTTLDKTKPFGMASSESFCVCCNKIIDIKKNSQETSASALHIKRLVGSRERKAMVEAMRVKMENEKLVQFNLDMGQTYAKVFTLPLEKLQDRGFADESSEFQNLFWNFVAYSRSMSALLEFCTETELSDYIARLIIWLSEVTNHPLEECSNAVQQAVGCEEVRKFVQKSSDGLLKSDFSNFVDALQMMIRASKGGTLTDGGMEHRL
eukprot:GHVL01016571.1.p1 GENE.GHVL01016571.1~~GHVL01016571.1.p1  ORF type:complete len:432 (+),score=91.25 GHVL01016571.1:51-1346(+)